MFHGSLLKTVVCISLSNNVRGSQDTVYHYQRCLIPRFVIDKTPVVLNDLRNRTVFHISSLKKKKD